MPLIGALLAAATLWSTDPQTPTFKARVEAVQVDVLVVNAGRPVRGLRLDDFELWDSGVRQRVTAVASEDVPVDLILMLDTSSSVAGERLERLREAVKAAAAALRPGLDRVSLFGASHRIALMTARAQEPGVIDRAADRLEAGGGTALIDGVTAGLLLPARPGERRLMIVYSDGLDTYSWLTRDQLMDVAHRSETVVYTVSGRAGPGQWGTGETLLDALARATGGRLLFGGTKHLADVFASIVGEYRNRYRLTYYPERVESTGWHEITVKCRKGKVTNARRGYYAGS